MAQEGSPDGAGLLIIACGALAHEITALRRANRWDHLDVRCLPAELHNRPERIPAAVRALIQASRCHYRSIFVAYADCGTGGLLDAVLREEGVERIPGAHCYEFFATGPVFAKLAEAEPGTFYLTDFLLRHFDRLVHARSRARPPPGAVPEPISAITAGWFIWRRRRRRDSLDAGTRHRGRAWACNSSIVETGYGDLAKTPRVAR